ncbi:hypothetical protein CC80DRAFT_598279 [Byssothecium circinans]|uniref:RNI-like protein n=1 Tax=Byssothecium circinans TaxID=147558 RepID=A0A6A5TD83_9PLEO|nr:hypothetical protein CC80DRAFT_598279 [Byssothecium circinans]
MSSGRAYPTEIQAVRWLPCAYTNNIFVIREQSSLCRIFHDASRTTPPRNRGNHHSKWAPIEDFLFTSLFINKLFFEEAARRLWEGCGVRFYAHWCGHATPGITQLATIAERDVKRAQIYANFLRSLSFELEEDMEGNFHPEARWHSQLTQLQYPQLKEVSFYPAGEDAPKFNTEVNIIHYAQPNICHFSVSSSSDVSNDLLEALGERCPKLRHFDLRVSEGGASITPNELLQFLEKFHLMKVLDIGNLEWSAECFEEVSKYPNLELLCCPPIQDDWLKKVNDGFPSLINLSTILSDEALENLQHIVPGMKYLRISPTAASHHQLAAASKFVHLGDLELRSFSDTEWSINGSELVLLSQSCPNLTELAVGSDEFSKRPSAAGLIDDTIDTAAQNFKSLEVLELYFDSTTPLTFFSIQSLAKHCPNLQRLELTCNIDWNYIERNNLGAIFPRLWSLEIDCHPASEPYGHVTDEDDEEEYEEKRKTLAKKIADLAPKMINFVVKNGTGMEEDLESAVTEITLDRD